MIARQSALVIGNSLLGAVQGYVMLFAMARYMGDELLGARAFALSLVYLLGVVCRLGFPITHARRLARGDDPAALNGTYLALKVALTAAFLGLAVTGGWVWFGLLGREVVDTTVAALWMGAFIVAAQSLRDLPVNSFRGLRLLVEREAVLFTNTLVTLLGTVAVAVAYAHSRGRWMPWPGAAEAVARLLRVEGPMGFSEALFGLMLAFFLGEVVALALAFALLWRRRIPVGRPERAVLQDYLRATLPLMVLSVGVVLTSRVSQVMLGFWWDAEELGHYAAAAKLCDLLFLVPTGVSIVLLPALSALQAAGDRKRLARLVLQAERWISLLLWPAVVYIAWQARPLLHILFSDEFLPAAAVLVILGFHSLLGSLRMPLQTKALGLGEDRFAGQVALAALAVTLVLNVLLIPHRVAGVPLAGLGAEGAGLAALGGGLVPLFAYRRKARAWTGHPYLSRHLVRHAAAAAATYAVLAVASGAGWLPAVARFYDLLWSAPLAVALYGALLVALRELGPGDLRSVRELLAAPQTAK